MGPVLVVGVREDLEGMLGAALRALGLRPFYFATDGEALRFAGKEEPLLCFVDILIQDPDGFELCRRIKSAHRDLSVVMISTLLTDTGFIDEELILAGADGFLPASSSPDRIKEEVARHLGALLQTERAPLRDPEVLIVEEDESLGGVYQEFAESFGLRVTLAKDGAQAVGVFAEGEFDLCLVDLNLSGGVSGEEVCGRIRRTSKGGDVPVVVMSASHHSASEVEQSLSRSGADDFLHKPFDAGALREILMVFLSGRMEIVGEGAVPALEGDALLEVGRHLGGRFPASGDLSRVGVLALLFKVFSRRLHGELTLELEGGERTIAFAGGRPVKESGISSDESFGELLVKRGYLSMEEVNEVLLDGELVGSLDEALIQRGLLTEAQGREIRAEQSKLRMLSCWNAREGTYSFAEFARAPRASLRVHSHNPLALIREGIERDCSANQIAAALQHAGSYYVLRSAFFDRFLPSFPFGGQERALADLIGGRRTLADLIQLRILDVNATLGLVWSLYLCRMIFFAERPAHGAPVAPRTSGNKTQVIATRRLGGLSLWSELFEREYLDLVESGGSAG